MMINHQSTPTIFLSQNKFNNSIKPFAKVEKPAGFGGPSDSNGFGANLIQD